MPTSIFYFPSFFNVYKSKMYQGSQPIFLLASLT